MPQEGKTPRTMFILIKLAYRSVTLPHLGQTDNLSLLLFSTYTSPRRSLRPSIKTIKPDLRTLSRLSPGISWRMWQGLQQINSKSSSNNILNTGASLAEEMNQFLPVLRFTGLFQHLHLSSTHTHVMGT